MNLFSYCGNDPINYFDDNGNAPKWLQIAGWIGLGVGLALCAAAVCILTCGVGTVTLIGTVAVGAAKGALIGAGIGTAVGAVTGGVGSCVSGQEFGSSEFWNYVLFGAMLGFGVGAVLGAVSGGINSGLKFGNFSSDGLLNEHFTKHGKEFEGLYKNSTEYAKGAKYTIKNGKYVKEMNGYIRFFGANGKANYAFVGMKYGGKISTFGIRSASQLAKVIPWIIVG